MQHCPCISTRLIKEVNSSRVLKWTLVSLFLLILSLVYQRLLIIKVCRLILIGSNRLSLIISVSNETQCESRDYRNALVINYDELTFPLCLPKISFIHCILFADPQFRQADIIVFNQLVLAYYGYLL